jgi:hypothetical protein
MYYVFVSLVDEHEGFAIREARMVVAIHATPDDDEDYTISGIVLIDGYLQSTNSSELRPNTKHFEDVDFCLCPYPYNKKEDEKHIEELQAEMEARLRLRRSKSNDK